MNKKIIILIYSLFINNILFSTGYYEYDEVPTSLKFGNLRSKIKIQLDESFISRDTSFYIKFGDNLIKKNNLKRAKQLLENLSYNLRQTLSFHLYYPKEINQGEDRLDIINDNKVSLEWKIKYIELRKMYENLSFKTGNEDYIFIDTEYDTALNKLKKLNNKIDQLLKDDQCPIKDHLYYLKGTIIFRHPWTYIQKKEAILLYKKAIKENPDSIKMPKFLYMLGIAYLRVHDNNIKKAENTFALLRKKYPKSYLVDDTFIVLGNKYADIGENNKAIKTYSKVFYYKDSDNWDDAKRKIDKIDQEYFYGETVNIKKKNSKWSRLKRVKMVLSAQKDANIFYNRHEYQKAFQYYEYAYKIMPDCIFNAKSLWKLYKTADEIIYDYQIKDKQYKKIIKKKKQQYYLTLLKKYPNSKYAEKAYLPEKISSKDDLSMTKIFIKIYYQNYQAKRLYKNLKLLADSIKELPQEKKEKHIRLLKTAGIDHLYYYQSEDLISLLKYYPEYKNKEQLLSYIFYNIDNYNTSEIKWLITYCSKYLEQTGDLNGFLKYAIITKIKSLYKLKSYNEGLSLIESYSKLYPKLSNSIEIIDLKAEAYYNKKSHPHKVKQLYNKIMDRTKKCKKEYFENNQERIQYHYHMKAMERLATIAEEEKDYKTAIKYYYKLEYRMDISHLLNNVLDIRDLNKFIKDREAYAHSWAVNVLYDRYMAKKKYKKALSAISIDKTEPNFKRNYHQKIPGNKVEALRIIINAEKEITKESDILKKARNLYQIATCFYKVNMFYHMASNKLRLSPFWSDHYYNKVYELKINHKIKENTLYMLALNQLKLNGIGVDQTSFPSYYNQDNDKYLEYFYNLYKNHPNSYLADDAVFWYGYFGGKQLDVLSILNRRYPQGDVAQVCIKNSLFIKKDIDNTAYLLKRHNLKLQELYNNPNYQFSKIIKSKLPKYGYKNRKMKFYLKFKSKAYQDQNTTITFIFNNKNIKIKDIKTDCDKKQIIKPDKKVWSNEKQQLIKNDKTILEFTINNWTFDDKKEIKFYIIPSSKGDFEYSYRITHKHPWIDELVSYPNTGRVDFQGFNCEKRKIKIKKWGFWGIGK